MGTRPQGPSDLLSDDRMGELRDAEGGTGEGAGREGDGREGDGQEGNGREGNGWGEGRRWRRRGRCRRDTVGGMAPPALRLFLVRHGESPSNREMRYLGRRDEPLTATGVRQAECLAEALAGLRVAAVHASPLERASATGRRIAEALGLALVTEARLIEQCFGDWEGLTRAEAAARGSEEREQLLRWERDPEAAPPGGESLAAVESRVLALVADLAAAHPGAWVTLVSHVSPIKALLCAAMGVPLTAARRLFLDPGTLSVVDWGESPVVRLFNAHGHLGWRQARWMEH